MSIILTAGKKAVNKQQIKKHTHKKGPQKDKTVDPPKSSDKTVVWHWILDGLNTVVMYTKSSGEVWCNGSTLPNVGGFTSNDLEFSIITDGRQEHQAVIKKIAIPGGCMTYQLFVDGKLILENLGQSPVESVTQITPEPTMDGNVAEPPSYNELYPAVEG